MDTRTILGKAAVFMAVVVGASLLPSRTAAAHCDTLGGPVVLTAKAALEKGDVTPVLKWVTKENEEEIGAAFKKTMAVRKLGGEAKDLADMYFFETLVRIHRAGEGAPYTGLKPADQVEPIIAASDKALESGSPEALVKMVTDHAAEGIREKFEKALKARTHADDSVAAGREFVAAYVEYTHYVEGIHNAVAATGEHHAEEK